MQIPSLAGPDSNDHDYVDTKTIKQKKTKEVTDN